MRKIYIGTSGFIYADWKGTFYPDGLSQTKWLSFYAKHFNTVEINATFYHSFPKKVYENWSAEVPSDFLFAIKGSRFITHIKRIKNVKEEIDKFFENASGLAHKLGVVLWQFPSSFKNTFDNRERLVNFLSLLPVNIRHAFEFRNGSMFDKEIYQLLDRKNTTIVVNDTCVFAVTDKVIGGFAYLRFHGPDSLYSSSYSDEQLENWSVKIVKYLKKRSVYAYFNNDVRGFAVKNAKTLRNLLER